MDKCFIDALFANTDKKVKGEENQMEEKKTNQQGLSYSWYMGLFYTAA